MLCKSLFLLAALVLLQACGGTPAIYYQDLKTAFSRPADVVLGAADVAASPYDLLYVRVGQQPRAALALAYLEHGQHKWVSADGAVFVMEQGRLVRTAGLSRNLHHVTNRAADPLQAGLNAVQYGRWLRLVDETNAFGYALDSQFVELEAEKLQVFERTIATRVLQERVTSVDTGQSFTNHFWFDAETGLLIQSEQQLTMAGPQIQFVHISPLIRQWQSEGSLPE